MVPNAENSVGQRATSEWVDTVRGATEGSGDSAGGGVITDKGDVVGVELEFGADWGIRDGRNEFVEGTSWRCGWTVVTWFAVEAAIDC